MAFAIRSGTLPCIRSFAEAERFFGKIKPVNSPTWSEHQRPLAARNAYHKRIEKHTLPDGEVAYELILHSTPLVTYRSNGVVTLVTHNSRSSHAFMWRLTPKGLHPHGHHGHMMVHATTAHGLAWYPGGVMRFTPAPDQPGVWTLKNEPSPRVREHLCRKTAAQIRKAAKPFITWAQGTRALLGKNKVNGSWGFRPSDTYPQTLSDLADTQKWAGFESVLGTDVAAWNRMAYKKLGALTEQSVSPFESPKRGTDARYT